MATIIQTPMYIVTNGTCVLADLHFQVTKVMMRLYSPESHNNAFALPHGTIIHLNFLLTYLFAYVGFKLKPNTVAWPLRLEVPAWNSLSFSCSFSLSFSFNPSGGYLGILNT